MLITADFALSKSVSLGYYWYLTVPKTTREPNYEEDKKLIEKQEAERQEELHEAEEARAAARAEAEKNK